MSRREFSRRELAQRLARGTRGERAERGERGPGARVAEERRATFSEFAPRSRRRAAGPSAGGSNEAAEGIEVAPDAEDLAREEAAVRNRDRAALIDTVLDELSAVGSLSDERFVSSFVDSRIRRGKGPMLIRAELRERGGDEGLIDRFLTFADGFWIDKVRAVREKRFGAAVPADAAERNRQARFLASRGFPSDLIRRAFERD